MRAQIVFSAIALAAVLAAAAIAQGDVGPLGGLDFQVGAAPDRALPATPA